MEETYLEIREGRTITFVWETPGEPIRESFDRETAFFDFEEGGTIAEELSLVCMAQQAIDDYGNKFNFSPENMFTKRKEPSEYISYLEEYAHTLLRQIEQENIYNDYYDEKIHSTAVNFELLRHMVCTYVGYALETSNKKELSSENDDVVRCINDIFRTAMYKTGERNGGNKAEGGLEKFRQLIDAINASPSIPTGYGHDKSKGNKCIALYKKWGRPEYTIAFSGNKDSDNDKDIDKFFNVKSNMYSYYAAIANSIGAALAVTNRNMTRYDFKGNSIVRYDKLDDIIRDQTKTYMDTYHSCCERKIFTLLSDINETVYSGKLFVKLPPCRECTLSIFYHIINKKKAFTMRVGLV